MPKLESCSDNLSDPSRCGSSHSLSYLFDLTEIDRFGIPLIILLGSSRYKKGNVEIGFYLRSYANRGTPWFINHPAVNPGQQASLSINIAIKASNL